MSSEQHRDTTIRKSYCCGNKPRSACSLAVFSVCGVAGPRARLVAGLAAPAAQARVLVPVRALGVRDLVVVVLPGARELAGSAAHSGLAAAVRPAPPSLNMKRLERYDETKTCFRCFLDSGNTK